MRRLLLNGSRIAGAWWLVFAVTIIILTMNGCLLYPQAMVATARLNHRQQEAGSPDRYRMLESGDSISISRVSLAEAPQNEQPYRLVAERFVRYAQAKDLSGMMRMTDPIIIKMSGSDRVSAAYVNHVIPDFETGPVTWEPASRFGPDDMGHPTYEFAGHIGDRKPFYIYVMNESGDLVVCIYSHPVSFGRSR
jgi:hypothetical protein